MKPKRCVKDLYASVTQRNLILDNKARIKVLKVVRQRFAIVVKRNLVIRTASRLATSRLLNKALHFRKEHAGRLLKATKEIKCLSIRGRKTLVIPSTLCPQSLNFMTQPINRYKGTLPYPLKNVAGPLLQMGLAYWYMLRKQPHLHSPKVNNTSSGGSVVVSVSHSQRPNSLLSLTSKTPLTSQ